MDRAAAKDYFECLLEWRWELEEVDKKHVREWADKDELAMLTFVTMLSPHVNDSTCSLESLLPSSVDSVNASFQASQRACAAAYLTSTDERKALHSCGACGIRDPTLEYREVTLCNDTLKRYQYTPQQLEHFDAASSQYKTLKSSYLWEGCGVRWCWRWRPWGAR